MTTLKMAILINDQGCHFDKIELNSIKKIKEWAKGRGGAYILDVDSVYNIMNGLDESVQFMAITLAASVNNGVYRVEDYEMAQEGGEYLKTKYFYDALNTLDQEDGVIYACFDTYGNPVDKELFDKIELEYGIK